MNQALAGLAIVFAAVGIVTLALAASDARAMEQANPHPLLQRRGGAIALVLALLQTGYAVLATGPASGIALVLSALMVAGLILIPAVNAAPKLVMRVGLLCALLAPLGGLLSISGT